jgi:hypothetical protein
VLFRSVEGTCIETRGAEDKLVRFSVSEGWMCVLLDEEIRGREWARRMEYKPAPR